MKNIIQVVRQTRSLSGRRHRALGGVIAVSAMLAYSLPSMAMEEMAEEDLRDASGAGIALALDDFSFRMAPTSYIEMTGSIPVGAAATAGWKRGDLRYYGLSMTGGERTNGVDWYSPAAAGAGTCAPGTDGLGCALGVAPINDFASVYNPYLIRVFQYAGYNYEGTACLGALVGGACSQVTTASPTVYEFIGPSKGDPWRWSFWGQLDLGVGQAWKTQTTAGGCLNGATTNITYCGLRSQSIILGNNFTTYRPDYAGGYISENKPTKFQLLQTPTDNVLEQSLSLVYESRLSGDFRFSVGQKNFGTNALNVVPDFNDTEGLYFKNVNAFLPLGQLNYQTLVFRSAPKVGGVNTGDFILELTPIANAAVVYNSFYCGTITCATTTFQGGKVGSTGAILTSDVVIQNPNPNTHGYVYWGTPSGAAPTEGSTTDASNGIYFRDNAGGIINIGRAKVEGMLIQSLKMTSLGAGT